MLGFLARQKSSRESRLLGYTGRREKVGVAELVLASREITRLNQPSLDERFKAIVNAPPKLTPTRSPSAR